MPLQNRVQPTGEILAHPARGAFMGNRGVLHDDAQRLTNTRWRHKAWVCCVTEFKGRRRKVMTPNRYTELFFHDEAVALAAGHRPCGECRRADYNAYLAAVGHEGKVSELDKTQHAERAIPRVFGQRRIMAEIDSLPNGAFILQQDVGPALVWGSEIFPFKPDGYTLPLKRPRGPIQVLTPATSLRALKQGYVPQVDAKIF